MTNNPRTPTDLAHALLQARHSGELLDADNWADVVRTPADAQAVQAALAPALGWRVALASNSPLSLCHHTLDALGLRPAFDTIVSAEQVVRGKPAPDIYHFAAQRLGVPAGRCLVFEDSVTGTHAARQAGMTVIAVPSEDQCFDGAQPVPHWVVPTLVALHGAAGQ